MPKLKQPDPLQKVAFGVLFQSVVRYCDRLSVKGSLDELRRGVSIVKKHVCCNMPWYKSVDFSCRFLDQFCSKDRPASHLKAALEILMDVETVGLRCTGPIVANLDPKDAHRFQRLQELDLSYFSTSIPPSLENYRLEDLATFIFPKKCLDRDLTIIGRNCPKLEVLKVPKSEVTDEGLRALSLCSELRVVDISDCPVSHTGINSLLSANKKIEEFSHCDGTGHSNACEMLSHLYPVVCPSMSRFVFKNDRDESSMDLKSIVAKFPNLTYLKMGSIIPEDLSTLKSLNKLAGLEISFGENMYYDEIEQTWDSLKALLTFIGANIKTLKLSCWDHGFFWNQDELNFIFESCPDIEHLGFDQGGCVVAIPPFRKLKELYPRIPIEFEQIEILDDPALEFGILPSLETLSIINYGMNLQAIESIMLDDVKFPNLSVIETNCMKAEDLEHIERTARANNLDFQIKNDPESNWYVEYRFGNTSEDDDNIDNAE